MTKVIKFKNNRIKKLLEENQKLSEDINKIVEEWQKKDQEVKKMSQKMERIKEKIRPLVAKEIKKEHELGEFDVVGRTSLNKDKIEVSIFNELEEIKKQLREKRKGDLEKKLKDEYAAEQVRKSEKK